MERRGVGVSGKVPDVSMIEARETDLLPALANGALSLSVI